MGQETSIAWTDHTFNLVWGCSKVSPACANCYAEEWAGRFKGQFGELWGVNAPRHTFGEKHWQEPLRWHRAAEKAGVNRLVFCSSMCDVFEDHDTVRGELVKLWPLIRATPRLTWQLLTKRPERILESLPSDWSVENYPNVWMGTTIENNQYCGRADSLREVPAVVRFVSYEPALGPLNRLNLKGLHWLIFGGESGPNRRPCDPQWARDIRDRCAAAGVAFFYKQTSGLKSGHDPFLDGVAYREFPANWSRKRERQQQLSMFE